MKMLQGAKLCHATEENKNENENKKIQIHLSGKASRKCADSKSGKCLYIYV